MSSSTITPATPLAVAAPRREVCLTLPQAELERRLEAHLLIARRIAV